ncbi:hypothetical protein ACFL0C_00080 [Patescibacteria group bacterium]
MFDVIDEIINSGSLIVSPPTGRYGSLGALGAAVINLFMGVAFGFGILSITYAMVSYVLSKGNPDNTKRAWNAFIYGVIATAVALLLVSLKFIAVRLFGITNSNIVNMPNF